MRMPSAYKKGYESARALDPEKARNYVAHTLIGDPEADELLEELAPLGQEELGRLIQIGMDGDERALRDVPAVLREFFESCAVPPDWLDLPGHTPGIRMFHRNSSLVLGAMVGGTLVEGFATNIAKSFFITGKVRDQGIRRLKQNNRHMVEIFLPGGLERDGDGWKLSVRIRLVHAMVRRLLNVSDDWDHEAWGTPVSAAHTGFAITAFSARSLKHLKRLGAQFNDEERASFMQVWRYSGHLMGIPETILFREESDALETFKIGLACEPDAELESISLANALVNSSPLIAGVTEPAARRELAHYVFQVSRALIGPQIADQLMFPRYPTFGVLWLFRMQNRYDDFMNRLFKSRARKNNKLSAMLEVSMVDPAGINYRLPDHVHAEESSRW
ncbi:MAG: oxygenase MpaB family protein [Dehalococcoidia bacterium]|nr:oxygenase MpaB family protein [Dehalococcoidia bacterium]